MDPSLATILAAFAGGIVLGLLVGLWAASSWFRRGAAAAALRFEAETDTLLDGVKHAFADISAETARRLNDENLRMAQATLQAERRLDVERSATDRAEIDARVGQILNQMDRMQALVRELEQSRAGQLGELAAKLDETNKQATALSGITDRLRRTLGRTQSRGRWGEHLAEEILSAAGLQPNVSFLRQKTLSDGSRPDFSFPLPGELWLHMDVKFPYDNFERSLDANDDAGRKKFETAFMRDVRQRVAEIANRAYVDPAERTVDFALMFVPNERVYIAMLELGPTLLPEAWRRRVAIVSPANLLAVLGLIRQLSTEQAINAAARELAGRVGEFLNVWEQHRNQSAKLISRLDTATDELRKFHAIDSRKLSNAAQNIAALTDRSVSAERPKDL